MSSRHRPITDQASTPHPVLPRLARQSSRTQPDPAERRSGELADALGRPGRRRDPLRLRRRLHDDGVPARAVRHGVHDPHCTARTLSASRASDVVLDRRSAPERRPGHPPPLGQRWSPSTACSTGSGTCGRSKSQLPDADARRDDRLEQPARVRDPGCSAERLRLHPAAVTGATRSAARTSARSSSTVRATHRRDRATGPSMPIRPGRPVTRRCTRARATTATRRSFAPLTVPGAGASLTFNARWNLEEDAAVRGTSATSRSRRTAVRRTRASHLHRHAARITTPAAIPAVVANLPGFSGDSAGFRPQTCSLAAYAGQTVLLAFRTINDPNTQGTDPNTPPGFWVDDVAIGGTAISDGSSASPAGSRRRRSTRSRSNGFTVQLAGLEDSRVRAPSRSRGCV